MVSSYSGEDLLDGGPFHHFDITFRALGGDAMGDAPRIEFESLDFSRKAAYSIAWHADYIDSYLYSPAWWAEPFVPGKGGNFVKRIKGAFSAYPELVKLHFDDTFTTEGIIDNWQRYGSGTLAGLEWAFRNRDVEAAHGILGVSVHAVQDFYSHSNWMDDPNRRNTTWLETAPSVRKNMNIFSGSYEWPGFTSQHSHGKMAFACTIPGNKQIKEVLDTVCFAASPFSNAAFCENHRHCKNSVSTEIKVLGSPIRNTILLNPPGIALDSSLLAPIGGHQRGILDRNGNFNPGQSRNMVSGAACSGYANFGADCEKDRDGICSRDIERRACQSDGDRVFATSKMLALRETQNWIKHIESEFNSLGSRHREFWNKVKTGDDLKDLDGDDAFERRTAVYEDFKRLPFQFLSVGPFPVNNNPTGVEKFDKKAGPSAEGYYVRLEIETDSLSGSGTDANISVSVVHTRGVNTFPLDYMPTNDPDAGARAKRLIAYNDFESGDKTVYTVGPVLGKPSAIILNNEAESTGEIFEALKKDFGVVMTKFLEGLRGFGLSLIAGNADYVGDTSLFLTYDDLIAASNSTKTTGLELDAGSEGHYRIRLNINESDEDDNRIGTVRHNQGWKSFTVFIQSIKVIESSDHDKFTPADEPFFFLAFTPLNGRQDRVNFSRIGPLEGAVDGVTLELSRTVRKDRIFQIPPQGSLNITMQQFESDSEARGDRDKLYKQFKNNLFQRSVGVNLEFADALGTAFGTEWTIDKVRAHVFYRGERLEFGSVLSDGKDRVLEADESAHYELDMEKMKVLFSEADDPANWHVK